MRLNKSAQYGLLLSLYLSRSGRANIEDVAKNLSMSKAFLQQVANKLRKGGVIRSIRGAGGGYELTQDATVANVMTALSVVPLINVNETLSLQAGQTEHRALVNFVGAVSFNLENLFSTKITEVSAALVQQELEQLNSLSDSATAN